MELIEGNDWRTIFKTTKIIELSYRGMISSDLDWKSFEDERKLGNRTSVQIE